MNDETSKLSADAEVELAVDGTLGHEFSPDDPVFVLAGEVYARLRADASPEEALSGGVRTTHEFLRTCGLTDEHKTAWAWVLRPVFDLPAGWSTVGADAEGAALAEEHFQREIAPAIIVIPAAETILALPIVGHDEDGQSVAGAMIAVPLLADVEPDDNALVGVATGAGILGVQLENSMRARAAKRSLQFAQAASRTQRDLIEPRERRAALRHAMTHLQACDALSYGRAVEHHENGEVEVESFGVSRLTEDAPPANIHGDLASLIDAVSVSLPVRVDGREEAVIELQSHHALGTVERDTLASISTAVAGSIVRARAAATIENLRRSATRRLVEAQERERSMVAADIHDGVLQQLGATAIRLELAQTRVEQHDFASASSIIADGAGEIRACAKELRALLMELRPQVLDDNGLSAALTELGRHVDGVEVDVTSDLPDDLGNEFAITIFRIVQEALTNIEKHAEATSAEVAVDQHDDVIVIRVSDDGVGYEGAVTGPSAEGSHLGLLGMRERAQMFGGSFAIQGASGGGTEVRVELPLRGMQPLSSESY